MLKIKTQQTREFLFKTSYLAAASLVIAIFFSGSSLSAQSRGWGRNNSGQLGLGSFDSPQPNPVTMGNSGDITGISTGEFFTLFLKADGTVLATGDNSSGQLGDGTQSVRSSPVAVVNLSNAVSVSASQLHSLALLADGTMMAWGRNAEGQIGNGGGGIGQFSVTPTPVINLTNVVAIASGGIYSLALKSDGTVWSWGANSNGQLGNGTTPNSSPHGTPTQVGANVTGFNNIIAISAGVNHAIALKSDGTVWVWGSNAFGEIGNGAAGGNQLVPVQNSSLFGVSQIAAAWHFSYALKPDGTVFGWGYNARGNIGNGTINSTGCQCNPSPQQTSITNVIDIKTTSEHTLARKTDGSIWSWGWNLYGQLGDGTILTTGCQCRSVPAQVTAAGTGNSLIAAGYFHSFAAIPSVTTPTGQNVVLQGDNLSVTFDSVITAGATGYMAIDPNSTGLNPGGFAVLANSPAYNVTTTAAFSGNVKVCLKTPTVFSLPTFNSLVILHGEGANLVNRTFSRNFARREICAQTTSLSPFVLAQAPTAALVSISGRVLTPDGQGVRNAQVKLTGAGGAIRFATTGTFGYFRFEEIEAGQTYMLEIISRRFTFANPVRVLSVADEVTDADFIAEPQ
jgi:alpha-tubulin suppressor-like RCC1 family protein